MLGNRNSHCQHDDSKLASCLCSCGPTLQMHLFSKIQSALLCTENESSRHIYHECKTLFRQYQSERSKYHLLKVDSRRHGKAKRRGGKAVRTKKTPFFRTPFFVVSPKTQTKKARGGLSTHSLFKYIPCSDCLILLPRCRHLC